MSHTGLAWEKVSEISGFRTMISLIEVEEYPVELGYGASKKKTQCYKSEVSR